MSSYTLHRITTWSPEPMYLAEFSEAATYARWRPETKHALRMTLPEAKHVLGWLRDHMGLGDIRMTRNTQQPTGQHAREAARPERLARCMSPEEHDPDCRCRKRAQKRAWGCGHATPVNTPEWAGGKL